MRERERLALRVARARPGKFMQLCKERTKKVTFLLVDGDKTLLFVPLFNPLSLSLSLSLSHFPLALSPSLFLSHTHSDPCATGK